MSLTLWLISKNLPLGHCDKYKEEYGTDAAKGYYAGMGGVGEKRMKRVAGIIINGLSQYKVAELVAEEWGQFNSQLRIDIRTICNGTGWRSGNVAKGIAHLNKLLKGDVLTPQTYGPTDRNIVNVNGRLVSVNCRINPAVAGAERAHAAFSRPPYYHKLSTTEKRKLNQQLAAERRRDRKEDY